MFFDGHETAHRLTIGKVLAAFELRNSALLIVLINVTN